MFRTADRKRLLVGLLLLAVILGLFLAFNRLPKIGIVGEDLDGPEVRVGLPDARGGAQKHLRARDPRALVGLVVAIERLRQAIELGWVFGDTGRSVVGLLQVEYSAPPASGEVTCSPSRSRVRISSLCSTSASRLLQCRNRPTALS